MRAAPLDPLTSDVFETDPTNAAVNPTTPATILVGVNGGGFFETTTGGM